MKFVVLCLCLWAMRSVGEEVRIAAAASLANVLKEIASAYERGSQDRVVFIFGGSHTLARQIEEGVPADLFISADERKMDNLQRKNLIVLPTRRSLLSNALAIVVSHESPLQVGGPEKLAQPEVKRVALGDPSAVPAGIYAREYLESLDLWRSIQPKVVPSENARAALAAVEAGNVDAAIVYRTDAAISKKVRVAFAVPVSAGPRISYPVALLREAPHPDAARRFLEHLSGAEARHVFEKAGFIVLERNAP